MRRAYDWAASFRSDLDKKNIFEGTGVYQAVEQGFISIPLEEGLAKFTQDANDAYIALHEANEAALTEVKEDGQDPNDNQWKTAVVDKLKQLADAFLATDPDPPPQDVEMAGGKKRRRKTRKGKSRRARYSRRR